MIPPSLLGLTEEEAQARRLEGQDNAIPFRPERSRKQILKENLLTIFDLNLVGLSFSQFLLGQPLDSAIVGVVVLSWAVSLRIIWWVMPLATKVEQAARSVGRRPGLNERS